jgi:hypothetical protein
MFRNTSYGVYCYNPYFDVLFERSTLLGAFLAVRFCAKELGYNNVVIRRLKFDKDGNVFKWKTVYTKYTK